MLAKPLISMGNQRNLDDQVTDSGFLHRNRELTLFPVHLGMHLRSWKLAIPIAFLREIQPWERLSSILGLPSWALLSQS